MSTIRAREGGVHNLAGQGITFLPKLVGVVISMYFVSASAMGTAFHHLLREQRGRAHHVLVMLFPPLARCLSGATLNRLLRSAPEISAPHSPDYLASIVLAHIHQIARHRGQGSAGLTSRFQVRAACAQPGVTTLEFCSVEIVTEPVKRVDVACPVAARQEGHLCFSRSTCDKVMVFLPLFLWTWRANRHTAAVATQ